jgi:uncharacterized protein (DUF1330 family)
VKIVEPIAVVLRRSAQLSLHSLGLSQASAAVRDGPEIEMARPQLEASFVPWEAHSGARCSARLTTAGESPIRGVMPAYLIADIEWHDEAKSAEYRKLLGPTLEKHGGRTLVANQAHALEGDWNPRRVVIIEFPSMEALQTWYHSPELVPVIRLRKEGADSKLIAVERPPTP